MAIYAVTHSLFHLLGSFPHITQDNNETLQKNKKISERFDHTPTYFELLFMTYPGVTGLLLLIITLTIAVTSLKCIRMKHFQIFGYTHMVLFPMFLFLLIVHGLSMWFVIVAPLAIFLITPNFIILIIQRNTRITSG